jgi:nitroreductase
MDNDVGDSRSIYLSDVEGVLSTTRSVRRRLDLERGVERDVIASCVELARQAPIGENRECARFLVVDDVEKRRLIAEVYRESVEEFVLKPLRERATAQPTSNISPHGGGQMKHVMDSAQYLFMHLNEVPVHVLVGTEARPPAASTGVDASIFYGSVYPAIWSFQLALRSRGLGSSITCVHLHYADRLVDALEIPANFTQIALLPVAYTKGLDFKPAVRRLEQDRVLRWNTFAPDVT